MLLTIFIIGLLLLIWFRTEAWVEYCRLFGLDCISFYRDFDDKYYQDVSLTYISYLRRYHNCFFIRLITCPICFGIWLGILACLSKFILMAFLVVLTGGGIVGLIVAGLGVIIQLPFLAVGGIFLFAVLDRLLG